MSNVILYGPPQSTYVRTARMACVDKGVPYTLEAVELKSDAHMALHPFGRVPIMRHGEVLLYETSAICRYIDANFDGPALQPTHPGPIGRMDQWISAINCYMYDTLIRQYLFSYIFPKGPDGQPDRAQIDAVVPEVKRQIGLVEAGLDGRDWLAGDYSLADMFMAPIMFYLGNTPESAEVIGSNPNIQRVGAVMRERASFVNTMPPPPPGQD